MNRLTSFFSKWIYSSITTFVIYNDVDLNHDSYTIYSNLISVDTVIERFVCLFLSSKV